MKKNFTPLRYPGGKSKFAPAIKEIIEHNSLHEHYVEPYAGGAGVALDLLFSGYCNQIHLNDIDSALYSFWLSVTTQTDDFIRLISNTTVTIDEWHKQKSLLVRDDITVLEKGFATFFLNRTNRSGILKAGVIGGLAQDGNYKLDCRFNKKQLISKIEKIGQFSDKIHVYNRDTLEWLPEIAGLISHNSLIYLDPPYYVKGQGLYRNFYKHEDHQAICNALGNIDIPWVTSYDNHPNICEMYSSYRQKTYSLNYSANKKIKGSEVVILSHHLKSVPDII